MSFSLIFCQTSLHTAHIQKVSPQSVYSYGLPSLVLLVNIQMCEMMSFPISFSVEFLPTQLTFIRFLPSMYSLMVYQVTRGRKNSLTKATFEHLGSGLAM